MASSAPWARPWSSSPRPGAKPPATRSPSSPTALLDLDLGDLVIAGWRKQGQLAAAAERTAANPGSSEVVELATHRVSSVHHPFVELLVNDAHVATVTFDLDIEFVDQGAGGHRARRPRGQPPHRGLRRGGHPGRRGHPAGQPPGALRAAAGRPLAAAAPPRRRRRPAALRRQVTTSVASGTVAVPTAATVDQPLLASAAPPAPIGPAGRLDVGEVLADALDSVTHGTAAGAWLFNTTRACLSYGDERTHSGEHLVSSSGCQPPRRDQNPR